jgi:hypothetical protein
MSSNDNSKHKHKVMKRLRLSNDDSSDSPKEETEEDEEMEEEVSSEESSMNQLDTY